MFQGWNKLLLTVKLLLLSLLVISCFSGVSVKALNQIWMDQSDDTVFTSLGTSMVARWSSDFRPHGAYVDEIKFVIFGKAEISKALSSLQMGEIDAYDDWFPENYWHEVNPDVEIEFPPITLYKQLVLNSGRFPTNITAFRRAMAYGLDKDRANEECTGGISIPQDSYIPLIATEWEVESQLTEHFYEPDFVSGNISLENAGFIDLDGDGWREYDKNHNGLWDAGVDLDDDDPSFVMDLGATAGYDPEIIICEIMQYGLEAMGIRSNVVEKDYTILLMDAFDGDFWAFCFNMVIDPTNPPAFLYNNFRTNQDSTGNIFWFSNSTIDAALDEMIAATTLEEVKEKAAEATTLLTFEQPAIVCYNKVHFNGYRNDKFDGFFEFKGNGYTGRNPYCGTKVHLKYSIGGPLGGTFNMSKFGDLETTNIHLVSERSTEMVMNYIYEKLWNIDPLTWDPIPGLAYDWDIEQTTANGDIRDGQKFTFYLYENETWHDGEPFTAADVNHSIHMWKDSPNHGPEMWDIYKVEVPDDHTIELYVNETGYFEWVDTTSFYITPEHIWRDVANVTTYSPPVAEVIGTGPYKLDALVPGEYISLLRHEDWRWDIREVPHKLQPFTILWPVGEEVIYGPITIQWTPEEDLFRHDVTYTVSYSADSGTSWITLVSDLTSTSYEWDSSTVEDGAQYLIRVNASCSEGLWYVAMSDTPFTIVNYHYIQPFTVLSPAGGEICFGQVTLQWIPGEDTFHHDVSYSVSYSADNGISWTTLASNLTTTSFVWDSTTVADGSQYLIQVNCSCTKGLWYVSTSDTPFTVYNLPHFQPFQVLSPVGGEIYFGQVIIQWASVEDIFNHSFTYTVSYSPDNGTSWIILTSNLTTTLYIWDSTTVADGSRYLIQVNASCSEGSWQVAISRAIFAIDNVPPTTTDFPPTQTSNSSNHPNTPLNLLPVLQILGPVTILFFVATVVIIVRRQRMSIR